MLARLALLASSTAVLLSLAGCGTPMVGEACSGSPQLGGCVEGAYCVIDDGPVTEASNDPTWNTFTCRQACTSQLDCADGMFCQPVATTPTLSACQPRNTAP